MTEITRQGESTSCESDCLNPQVEVYIRETNKILENIEDMDAAFIEAVDEKFWELI